MARIRFYPRNMGSGGCSRLRDELRRRGHNVFKVRGNGSYVPRAADTVISWGNSTPKGWRILNGPAPIGNAQNKLRTFQALEQAGVSIPPFTTDRNVARTWLENDVEVLARTLLEASGGRGITVVSPDDDTLPQAPLYVQYIKKMNEYRVHVFNGQVIDITEKKRRREFDGQRDTHIRNLDNGYVFIRDDVRPDASVGPLAVSAVHALGLDFGAVDIIWNNRRHQAYVLEVNTAPGLEGTTVERYADAIERLAGPPRQRPARPAPVNRPRLTEGARRGGTGAVRTQRPSVRPTQPPPAPRPRFNNDRNNDNTDF